MLALLDQAEPFAASEAEATIARAAVERLQAVAAAKQDITMFLKDDGRPNVVVPLPARAVGLILRVLESMADRVPISVIPHEAELTTQQAADYLNVSRPFLVALIDKGEINHRVVGRHRRVQFGDLLDFETRSKAKRRAAIDEMAAEARALDLD